MSYVLGLTGSIGMGKTTTAGFFREAGVPVWDADAAVHRLYDGGAAVPVIAGLVPEAVSGGKVDRGVLRAAVLADSGLLKKIEAAVHPLVSADRQAFLDEHAQAPLVVCDIPLLFETGADKWLDGVLVVTADEKTQRARVLERGSMDEAAFDAILAKQVPDAEKRAKADFVIDTGKGMDHARAAVLSLIEQLTGEADA